MAADITAVFREAGWPMDVITDAAKQPTICDGVDSFVEQLFHGDHMDDIVVLPDGVRKIGQFECMPREILEPCTQASDVSAYLDAVDEKYLERLKGRVYVFDRDHTTEKDELRRNEKGDRMQSLHEKRAELQRRMRMDESFKQRVEPERTYIGEVRYLERWRNTESLLNERVKTVLSADVKDFVGERQEHMLYWDRNNEGVFIGGNNTGSCMHVDQVLWSNIGKNYHGYKLLVAWKWADSLDVLDKHYMSIFTPPLSESQTAALRSAAKIAMVGPGDLFLFSGANPHMAVCVGPQLSLTAYESFLNLHPRHCRVFAQTNKEAHFEECGMDEEDLKDVQLDVADQVNLLVERIHDGKLQDQRVIGALRDAVHALCEDSYLRRHIDLCDWKPRPRGSKKRSASPAAPCSRSSSAKRSRSAASNTSTCSAEAAAGSPPQLALSEDDSPEASPARQGAATAQHAAAAKAAGVGTAASAAQGSGRVRDRRWGTPLAKS